MGSNYWQEKVPRRSHRGEMTQAKAYKRYIQDRFSDLAGLALGNQIYKRRNGSDGLGVQV